MASPTPPKWGRVWRYQGTRGVTWRIRYRDASGRRILETLGKEPAWNRKRAETELRRRLVDVERDGYTQPQKLTFAAFSERWLDEYLPGRGLKFTTTEGYQQTLRKHLLPAFGHLTLEELERKPELIDRYVTTKISSGLAPKTVTNQLVLLGVMLKRATRWRLIERNPVLDCDRPRQRQPEMNILSEVEIARLWTAYQHLEQNAETEIERAWWQLARTLTFVALGTAMRRGELLALRWKDVRLLDGVAQVRQALVRGQFTTPKSKASHRLLELGPKTIQLLSEHWQHTHYQHDNDLVFCHPQKGTPLDPSKISPAYLRPALRHAGIDKPIRAFHDLRHTALTHEAAAATRWPTSNKKRATHKHRSPNATSTPHKSSSPAPPLEERLVSSPNATENTPNLVGRSQGVTFPVEPSISRMVGHQAVRSGASRARTGDLLGAITT